MSHPVYFEFGEMHYWARLDCGKWCIFEDRPGGDGCGTSAQLAAVDTIDEALAFCESHSREAK